MCPGTRVDQPTPDMLRYKDKDLGTGLLQQLNLLRHEGVLTDVVLCSENLQLTCHRNVLASSSAYFRAMFCGNFRESAQPRVVLNGISSVALNTVVDYIYTGMAIITADLALPLMQAASMLQLDRLFEACSAFLQTQLCADNCLAMIRLAETLHCASLSTRACEMAARCFSAVTNTEDFPNLSLCELTRVLGDDQLVAGEEQACEVALSWVRHNPRARLEVLGEVLSKLRLRHIHPAYLFQFVASDPLVLSSPLASELFEAIRRLLFSVETVPCPNVIADAWASPRREAYQEALVLVGGRRDGRQTSRETLLLDEGTREWRRLTKMPIRVYRASYACIQRVLYVLGGLVMSAGSNSAGRPTNAVYSLSLDTNQWRKDEPMLSPRYAHHSVSHLHFLFILGGVGGDGQPTGTVERYNTMFSQWESVAPMPNVVLHPAVATHDQRIFVFGGEDIEQNPVRMIQVYHMARNFWSKIETRVVKNVCAPAAVIAGKIYIIGGYTRRVIAYDTKENRFVKCESLRDRRMRHSATVIDNKLYVTGGRFINNHDIIEDSDGFDCYDPVTDTWVSRGKLPHKLFDHGSVPLICVSEKSPS